MRVLDSSLKSSRDSLLGCMGEFDPVRKKWCEGWDGSAVRVVVE
jgi:hypothetical protein